MKECVALFDFDGTITHKDSLASFIKFYKGKLQFIAGLIVLSPYLIAYKTGILSNYKAKEILIKFFFKDEDVNVFNEKAEHFSTSGLYKILSPEAMDRIRYHQEKQHRIIVVSASIENYLKGWCKKNNIELIGTQLEVKQNKITGKFLGLNCHGIEKVNRIKKHLALETYSEIYAYGDSKGDYPMLDIATKKFFRSFKEKEPL